MITGAKTFTQKKQFGCDCTVQVRQPRLSEILSNKAATGLSTLQERISDVLEMLKHSFRERTRLEC
jgi:hypothetical protein